jgi:hypothetical protein
MTCGAVIGAYSVLAADPAAEQSRRNQEASDTNMKKHPSNPGEKTEVKRRTPEETGFPSPIDIATTFAAGELFNSAASAGSDSISGGGGTFDGGGASGDF